MMTDSARRPPAGWHRQRDDTEPDHRQTYEFKNQRVHDNFSMKHWETCRGCVDCLLTDRDGSCRWWTAG